MKKFIISCFLFVSGHLFAIEKLSDPYLVQYGSQKAPVHIVQYYSFTCPHCVALFRKQFQKIKDNYIEQELVYWTFHPVPLDLLTVQGMDCLSRLSERDRKVFLEAILEELFIDQPKLSADLMQKGMELLGKPIQDLQEKEYLKKTEAFQDAFVFLKEADEIEALPSVDVNGKFISAQVPDIDFIEDQLRKMGRKN